MRFRLLAGSIILTALLVNFFIASCTGSSKEDKGKATTDSHQIQAGVIILTDGDPTTGELTLKDDNGRPAHTFKVDHGQKIKWILRGNNPNVRQIVDITLKDMEGNTEIFSGKPERDGNSNNWKATVRNDAFGENEYYNIIWLDKDGVQRIYDPLIQVRPRPTTTQ